MIWLVFALGLLVGLLAGIALDDALDLYRASRKERTMTPPTRRPSSRTLLTTGLVVAVAVQLLVGIMLIDARRDQARGERERVAYTTCTNQWQQDFARAYKARLTAANDVAAALERVVRAVSDDNPREFDRALAAYIALRDDQAEQIQQSPYPPLPKTLCGEQP